MQKQIKIFWGRYPNENYPNDNYELTVDLNDENSKEYSVSLTSIVSAGDAAADNMDLQEGTWDLNQIYDVVANNPNLRKEGDKIYIKKGFDEEKGNQHNPIYPFGDARLEYFIPASNNNDSSDDDLMGDGFVFGGGKRKRTRHTFVGKKVLPLPPPSQQSEFYKKTKANIENATADFLREEKIQKNASLTYTPSEENFILEATKGGGNPKTATDVKGNKLIRNIVREFPPIPKKGGRKSRKKKKRTKRRKSRKKRRRTKRKRGRKSPKRKRGRKSTKRRRH
jgi:hypothetical protein